MTGREIFSPLIDVPTPAEKLGKCWCRVPMTNHAKPSSACVIRARGKQGSRTKVPKDGGQRSGRSRFTGSQGSQRRSSGRNDKKKIQPKQNLCE